MMNQSSYTQWAKKKMNKRERGENFLAITFLLFMTTFIHSMIIDLFSDYSNAEPNNRKIDSFYCCRSEN